MSKHLVLALTTVLIGALTACSTPGASGANSNAPETHSSPSAPASPELHMVSNGGHKLAFHVTPGALPVIVLDAGGGLYSSYWKDMVPVLASKTGSKIITYDRAGMGASDEVPGPWRVEDAVSDLEAGLTELGVTQDVVLVSHSLAGEIATYFVNKNPRMVSGAVLVDASLPDLYTDEVLARLEPAMEAQRSALLGQPSTKETRQLLAVLSNYGPAHRAYHKLSWPQGIPVTAIVSSKTPFDTPDEAQMWRDAQTRFTRAAPNRRLVVAENSSHDIAVDRPDVIATAVDNMVKTVR